MGKKTQLLKVGDVADLFRVTQRSVWRLLASGALKKVKVGGATRITEKALNQYLSDIEGGEE